jgi:hypothetical protein
MDEAAVVHLGEILDETGAEGQAIRVERGGRLSREDSEDAV